MYELPEEEGIAYLIEMGANCIPITLSSLLNTFKDAKYDYSGNIEGILRRIAQTYTAGNNQKA